MCIEGANAGDFAGINVIDLLLGVCSADNPSYAQILVDKFLFMLPEEQDLLRDCMRRRSFMDLFLEELDKNSAEDGFKTILRLIWMLLIYMAKQRLFITTTGA